MAFFLRVLKVGVGQADYGGDNRARERLVLAGLDHVVRRSVARTAAIRLALPTDREFSGSRASS